MKNLARLSILNTSHSWKGRTALPLHLAGVHSEPVGHTTPMLPPPPVDAQRSSAVGLPGMSVSDEWTIAPSLLQVATPQVSLVVCKKRLIRLRLLPESACARLTGVLGGDESFVVRLKIGPLTSFRSYERSSDLIMKSPNA